MKDLRLKFLFVFFLSGSLISQNKATLKFGNYKANLYPCPYYDSTQTYGFCAIDSVNSISLELLGYGSFKDSILGINTDVYFQIHHDSVFSLTHLIDFRFKTPKKVDFKINFPNYVDTEVSMLYDLILVETKTFRQRSPILAQSEIPKFLLGLMSDSKNGFLQITNIFIYVNGKDVGHFSCGNLGIIW